MNPITFLYDQEPLVETNGSYYSKQLNAHIPINGLSIGQIKNSNTDKLAVLQQRHPIGLFAKEVFLPIPHILSHHCETRHCSLSSFHGKAIYELRVRAPLEFIEYCETNENVLKLLPPSLINSINQGNTLLLYKEMQDLSYEKSKFLRLRTLFKDAGIDTNHIIILSNECHKTTDTYGMNVIFWDFYQSVVRYDMPYDLQTVNQHYDYRMNNDTKRFICLNRVPRSQRVAFVYFLYAYKLLNYFNVSMSTLMEFTGDTKKRSFNYSTPLIKSIARYSEANFKKFKKLLPLQYDQDDPMKFWSWDIYNENMCKNNHVFVVTETWWNEKPLPILTEKTFKSIALKMPFILLAQPHSLSKLKEDGYQSFSELWDESYDDIEDDTQRFTKVCTLVKKLCNMSDTDFMKMIKKSKSIVDHNYNVLKNNTKDQEIIDRLLKWNNTP